MKTFTILFSIIISGVIEGEYRCLYILYKIEHQAGYLLFHYLFIAKRLSLMQIKYALYFGKLTATIMPYNLEERCIKTYLFIIYRFMIRLHTFKCINICSFKRRLRR